MLNTDGIDVDMSSDVRIDRSFICTKDDAICVKATRNSDLSGNPARILATNNLVSARDAALKAGAASRKRRGSRTSASSTTTSSTRVVPCRSSCGTGPPMSA